MRRVTRYQQCLRWMTLLATLSGTPTRVTVGEEEIRRSPVTQIQVGENTSAAFVDEPSRHFEAAQGALLRGRNVQAAEHVRIASTFLRLETARAMADGKSMLNASVDELQRLATSIESDQSPSIEAVQQAFSRAHYALAVHHCIKSNCVCCQPSAFENRREMNRVGHDLNAAAVHLERGTLWTGKETDDASLKVLDVSQFTADQLIQSGNVPQSEVVHAIRSLRDRLEHLTGRRIMLAPPLTADDKSGPSVFH